MMQLVELAQHGGCVVGDPMQADAIAGFIGVEDAVTGAGIRPQRIADAAGIDDMLPVQAAFLWQMGMPDQDQ